MHSQNPPAAASGQGPRRTSAPIISVADWLTRDLPPLQWALGNRFAAGELTVGASLGPERWAIWLAIQSALAIALGREIGGEEPHRPGAVLYLTDHDPATVKAVVGNILEWHSIDPSAIAGRFHVMKCAPGIFTEATRDRWGVKRSPRAEKLLAHIRERAIVHAVVDPIDLIHTGSGALPFAAMIELRRIAEEANVSMDLLCRDEGAPPYLAPNLTAAAIYWRADCTADGFVIANQARNAYERDRSAWTGGALEIPEAEEHEVAP